MQQTQDKTELFAKTPVPSALRAMIVPTIISQIIILIYNMADTFYIGRTNNPYMVAGLSLLLPIFNITLCFAGLAGVGGGTLISRLMGRQEEKEARKVSAFALSLSLVVAALFSVGMGLFMTPALRLLGAGENTLLYAEQYAFCVIVLGAVPTVLSNVMSTLIRSIGQSKSAGFGIALGGILNILLDPLFMFVLLPKGSEVLGVGIATLLSNCIACGYFLVIIIKQRNKSVITFSFRDGLPSRESIKELFAVGIPSAVATLLFDLDYIIMDKLMVSYHDVAMAAIGIVLKVERLPLNIGIGICQGMMPLVAYNFAAGNQKRTDDTIRLSRRIGLGLAGITLILYQLFASDLIRFFIMDPQTVELATKFLRIRVLATPLMFLSFFTVYLFQAFGKGDKSLLLGMVRWLVFNIPMLFLLNHLIGMFGIVWSQITADILTVLFSLYIYKKYRPNMAEES